MRTFEILPGVSSRRSRASKMEQPRWKERIKLTKLSSVPHPCGGSNAFLPTKCQLQISYISYDIDTCDI